MSDTESELGDENGRLTIRYWNTIGRFEEIAIDDCDESFEHATIDQFKRNICDIIGIKYRNHSSNVLKHISGLNGVKSDRCLCDFVQKSIKMKVKKKKWQWLKKMNKKRIVCWFIIMLVNQTKSKRKEFQMRAEVILDPILDPILQIFW